jgi:hypothetical protein
MNNTSGNREINLPAWVLVIGILMIISLSAAGIVYAVWQSVQQMQRTVQPVTDVTSDLGTQVAQMMNPTPTILPDPVTVIYQVRSLARLETIQYSLEKVITAETGQGIFGLLFGDRMIFVAHGIVIAGVDLSRLGPQDLWLQENTLYVRLPEPELFIATLDNDQSYVYDRDTGLLTKGDINLETAARQAAEEAIAQAAVEDGILNLARQNAESFLYRLFVQLGYKQVIFVQATPVAPAVLTTPAP